MCACIFTDVRNIWKIRNEGDHKGKCVNFGRVKHVLQADVREIIVTADWNKK